MTPVAPKIPAAVAKRAPGWGVGRLPSRTGITGRDGRVLRRGVEKLGIVLIVLGCSIHGIVTTTAVVEGGERKINACGRASS